MISLVFAAALAAAAPANATPQDATAPAANAPPVAVADKGPKPNKQGLICRKEKVVGSNLASRICMKPEEWDAKRASGQELTKEYQRGQPYEAH